MNKVAAPSDDAKTTEREFENAGFRVEKVGGTTVFERGVPDSVVEASRVFINGNGKGKADPKTSTNGGGRTAAAVQDERGKK